MSDSQIQQVRKWLFQPEANLFRQILSANATLLQHEAGGLLVAGVLNDSDEENAAKMKVDETIPFLNTLAVLENLHDKEDYFFRLEPEML